jgi:3-deoxy-D-manno-octulosonic-acid transferase
MSLLIRTGTALYHLGIRLSAPFIPKAKQWVDGRKGLWERLEEHAPSLQGCLWMHCASVGEFEQGRPVLEALKAERPDLPVLLTFFSPSGYDAYKGFPLATHVEYLPTDSRDNAERLLRTIRPRCVVFVKYEFWQAHLDALQRNANPTYLVSATFRAKQPFFRWFGGGHRAMLRTFSRRMRKRAHAQTTLPCWSTPTKALARC